MEVKPLSLILPHRLSFFDCGVDELNRYLKQFSRKNDKIGIGRTYVLIDGSDLVGYYTLSSAQLRIDELPTSHQNRLPRYPLPAARIGRLAINLQFQGRGLGGELLAEAISRCLNVSKEIAIYSILVDAKNDQALNFYLKNGFIQLAEGPHSLFLPIETAQKALEPATSLSQT